MLASVPELHSQSDTRSLADVHYHRSKAPELASLLCPSEVGPGTCDETVP